MADLDLVYQPEDRQQAIADHQEGTLVGLAGPGTGKTYSFLKRIATLVGDRQVSTEEICYLTFIKEIARAFQSDYADYFTTEDKPEKDPRISTLHSFACRLIRNQGFQNGYDGHLHFTSTADPDDERSNVFLNDLLPHIQHGELRTIPRLRELLEQTKRAWQRSENPMLLPEPIPMVTTRSLNLARAYRLVDWDYTIPFAHMLLQELDPAPPWITQLRHFMVDEYQDFNQAEQDFLRTLLHRAASAVIVGDDNQSLYGGRGGSPDGLRKLYTSPGVDKVTLVYCRRCRANILTASNLFLSIMAPSARLLLPRAPEGEVTCHVFKSAKAELAFLIPCLRERLATLPASAKPKDGLVCLFPTRQILQHYLAMLQKADVPSYSRRPVPHPERFFLRQALTLLGMPHQRFTERLLLQRFANIKPGSKRAMVQLVLDHDIAPSEAVVRLIAAGEITGKAKTDGEIFCQLCESLASQDSVRAGQALVPHLNRDLKPEQVTEALEKFLDRDDRDMDEAIEETCDTLLPESAPAPEDPRAVLCLTMHGAKGLTKRTVVLPGLEQAWLPGEAQNERLAELQRLFYVALTRATDQVLITVPRTRARGDPLNRRTPGCGEPSIFIQQSGIPREIHW